MLRLGWPFARTAPPGGLRLRDLPRLVDAQREAARRRALARRPELTYLFWESTLRCNLRCSHCGSSCETRSPLSELGTAEVLRILDTIAEDFDPSRIFVSITGGEPLLREDLVEVVAHMTRLGMRSCIVTNGTLLGEEAARRLVGAGMRSVTISCDGLEAEHEAVRGKGTHRKALAAIGTARRAGFALVEAITCVRPANLRSLAGIERAVRDAGAQHWRLITIDRMGRQAGRADPEMWLDPPQASELLDFVEDRRRARAAPSDLEVRFSCGGFLGVHRDLAVRPAWGQCYAGLCVGSILCDGRVGACPSLPRSWAQGSAREERFSSIWHRRFGSYRRFEWRRSGPCRDCSWFGVCLGGGLHERLAQPESFCWLDRQET
jgi:radical SAM protein with 4Fe4S-binding SPASM domain